MLLKGQIQEAIALINSLHPELLDTNRYLYFHLQVNVYFISCCKTCWLVLIDQNASWEMWIVFSLCISISSNVVLYFVVIIYSASAATALDRVDSFEGDGGCSWIRPVSAGRAGWGESRVPDRDGENASPAGVWQPRGLPLWRFAEHDAETEGETKAPVTAPVPLVWDESFNSQMLIFCVQMFNCNFLPRYGVK